MSNQYSVLTLQQFIDEKFDGNNTTAAEFFDKHNSDSRNITRQQVIRWLKQNMVVINNTQLASVKLTINN